MAIEYQLLISFSKEQFDAESRNQGKQQETR